MKNVQEKIGYTFKNVNLLETALTHSSYANECKKENNERLEFLGDSVLSVIISDYIFRRLPNVDEGWLSKYRATLVCEQSLNEISKKISLSKFILLGKGEEMTGGRQRASIVSDAFEAVLAAIYLDGGMETARKWVIDLMRDSINEVVTDNGNTVIARDLNSTNGMYVEGHHVEAATLLDGNTHNRSARCRECPIRL